MFGSGNVEVVSLAARSSGSSTIKSRVYKWVTGKSRVYKWVTRVTGKSRVYKWVVQVGYEVILTLGANTRAHLTRYPLSAGEMIPPYNRDTKL